jgi:hypothetical protein
MRRDPCSDRGEIEFENFIKDKEIMPKGGLEPWDFCNLFKMSEL